ncbi:MAG: dienelactone hydrolase family protein [Acidimicrobiia bacterium]
MTGEAALAGWTRGEWAADGISHPTYRRGSGPGVIVVHEIPGITPTVARFAQEVVDAGFTVVMPLLVGEVGRPPSAGYMASSAARVCISREFTTMAVGRTSPVIAWLRALARELHASCGGPGVGAVGMCFSGGFALGMMLDDVMVAPVLSQPSLPFAIGRRRGADLGLSDEDAARVSRRAADGCSVLGLRFDGDRLVGDRFSTLRNLLGDAFVAVEYPSTSPKDHSVLTEQRRDDAVRRVVAFLRERLA